ncbi:MAG: helix-turn-helix domain-containing protein [Clostridiales bacterium]|nr:helix-turn-helix domain-containing protein [Clostridiales bacterium]
MLFARGETMDRFTQNLRRARKAAGLTQQQLADRLYVTRQSVSSWELGRTEPDLQTLTELAEVFETDAGSLLGEAGRPAYPRLQKRFVTGFAVCAGLLLMLFCLELGLFAYWRKLALHDYGVALYAALWKLSVPPLLWYSSGVGAVCFFAMWSPVRCGKQARLALGLPVLALMAQYLAVALGNLDGVRVWLAPLLRRPAGKLAIQIILPGLIGVCTGLFACSERSV